MVSDVAAVRPLRQDVTVHHQRGLSVIVGEELARGRVAPVSHFRFIVCRDFWTLLIPTDFVICTRGLSGL